MKLVGVRFFGVRTCLVFIFLLSLGLKGAYSTLNVFISTPRFNLPIMPYVLLFCAAGTAPIMRYLSGRLLRPDIQPIDRAEE